MNHSPENRAPGFPVGALNALLPLAFAEDLGSGDVTTEATVPADSVSKGVLIAKQEGVVAGLPLVEHVFAHRGALCNLETLCADGARVGAGEVLMRLEGPTRGLLECERILLNFLQRLSGVATVTRKFVDALGGSKTKVLDTRKTLPGFRELDKYAVRMGGGVNHRQGLFDQVLIKDNHIEACSGDVLLAVERARNFHGTRFRIEAEAETLAQVEALLSSSVDIILLDNMNDAALASAVKARERAPHIQLEASGNMDLERVGRIAGLGLDFVSVGALTHSVPAMDISLRFSDKG